MGTVYLGTDTRLDRTVALKIMHAELANDEDFVRRFVGEARSVARLSHPNVVGVYDQVLTGARCTWPWSTCPAARCATC